MNSGDTILNSTPGTLNRAGVEPALQPIDIAGSYKINNILTNDKTNRTLLAFYTDQPLL